jgi:hypothetical protein
MEVAEEREAARRRRQLPLSSIAAAARRSGLTTTEVQERYDQGKEEEHERKRRDEGHDRRDDWCVLQTFTFTARIFQLCGVLRSVVREEKRTTAVVFNRYIH